MANVLVVEDEANIRLVLKLALEEEGHQVVTTDNGQECLARLEQGLWPDVILADLCMPRLSGRALVEEIRTNDEYRHIPIAIVTGSVPVSSELPPKGTYQALISKPFDLGVIYETVKKLTSPQCTFWPDSQIITSIM